MATLVIVTHEFDRFVYREGAGPVSSIYLLYDVLRHLGAFGHNSRVVLGPVAEPGDVAMLHVDCTVVPDEYLALAGHYARTINFGTGDISKRKVSRLMLAREDRWDGPVIVKNNLNRGGRLEHFHNLRAGLWGRPPPHPDARHMETYPVLDRIGDVGDAVWDDPSLVVERFVPERDGDNFVTRSWVFMGARERCTRFVSSAAIAKAADVLRFEPVPVPEQLRAERERLGFDYGKFDFVIHDGEPVLLDANRTPGTAGPIRELLEKGARNLAEGLNEMIVNGTNG